MIKYCTSDFRTITSNCFFSDDLTFHCNAKGLIMIPSDPSNQEITRKYGDDIIEIFKSIGMNFETVKYIFDKDDVLSEDFNIDNYSVIFLMGGRTKCQNRFIRSIEFLDIISVFEGALIGQSAGALNLCKSAYLSPDYDEVFEIEFIEGLGVVNDMFEVHFDIDDHNKKQFIIDSSKDMLCICDNGAIKYDESGSVCFGDVYRYSDGVFDLLQV